MIANDNQLKIMEFLTSYGRKMAKDKGCCFDQKCKVIGLPK